MKVLIDSRESKKRISNVRNLLDSELIESDISTFEVGDYLLVNDNGGVVASIEYKTYADFVSSIMNGHLESQLHDMDNYTNPYLFVVGTYGLWKKRCNINISKKSIEGFKVKTLVEHKTKLIQFDSEREAIEAMVMILNRNKKHNGDNMLSLPERHKSTGNPQLDMYLSIPKIGKVRAQTYARALPFYMFLTICHQGDARTVFKSVYNLTVPDTLIEYCKGL